MPGELQATIQLSDHTLGGQHISRHLPFSGADTKNVVASISVAGACQYAVGELTTLFQLLSYLIIQGENKDLGCQPP